MTLENKDHRINEIQQRRILRLQQVREQSKDIAKKIRQRAKVAKSRHVEVDSQKEKEYFECQDKLLKRLQKLYIEGVNNVGSAHRDVHQSSKDIVNREDLSKLRGKEAAAILRRTKQEKLDEQKKLLDRKLKAREVANEISREKSLTVFKTLDKPYNSEGVPNNSLVNINTEVKEKDGEKLNFDKDKADVTKNDMGTQWETERLPNEWEPNMPLLPLSNNEPKDSIRENVDKSSKKPNLFALSDEMLQNLNSDSLNTKERSTFKPSLTLVTEYLHNRNLRLRQPELPPQKKIEDLKSIKQTILRTRATKTDGTVYDNVCHVLDEQVIPVPSWQSEINNRICNIDEHNHIPNFTYNSITTVSKFCHQHNPNITFVRSPRNQSRIGQQMLCYSSNMRSGNKERLSSISHRESSSHKRDLVTVYNHNTKDARSMSCGEERLVCREEKSEDDAYSQAMREVSFANSSEKENLNKQQKDLRTRIAVQKHTVDKEYEETLQFLNCLQRNKGDHNNTYITEEQRKRHKEQHQRKLQTEFQKVERESCRNNCKHKRRHVIASENGNKSKSPTNFGDESKEQYSWMPVPESDHNLAIHTLPTSTKNKGGNSVKFSQMNSYHEYRSRHRHTPPTKDVNQEKRNKKPLETIVINQSGSSDDSNPSETNSTEDLNLYLCSKDEDRLSEADRIVIYKILKKRKASKVHTNEKVSKSLSTNIENHKITETDNQNSTNDDVHRGVSFDDLQEGVYRGVSRQGDNMKSVNVPENPENFENNTGIRHQSCNTRELSSENIDISQRKKGDDKSCTAGASESNISKHSIPQPSAAISNLSFKTATSDKVAVSEEGFIKFIDDTGNEGDKFYIGASGFLKNDNYEVVIQLRKKDIEGQNKKVSCRQESDNEIITKTADSKSQDKCNLTDEKSLPKSNGEKDLENVNVEILPQFQTTDVEEKASVESLNISEENNSNGKQNKDLCGVSTTVNEMPNVCDKSVITSFQEPYITLKCDANQDIMPRAATSTYTQTTFSSPTPRPVYMHLNSSTSTTYMSPPDTILPRSLGHRRIFSNKDMYDSGDSLPLQDNVDVKHRQYNENKNANKKELSKKKCKKIYKNTTMTPPNTARRPHLDDVTVTSKSSKCCKCIRRHEKRMKPKKILKHNSLNGSRVNQLESQASKHRNPCLEPIVKAYINKLLTIKEGGLKAVEVINQDCSSVTTPGSSIINVATNIDGRKPINEKISLEQLKNLLANNILKSNNYHQISNRTSVEDLSVPVKKKHSQISKKKSVHKVKSFNVSRRFIKSSSSSKSIISQLMNFNSSNNKPLSVIKDVNNFDIAHVRNISRSKSYPTPRTEYGDILNCSIKSDPISKNHKRTSENNYHKGSTSVPPHKTYCCQKSNKMPLSRASSTGKEDFNNLLSSDITPSNMPINISTQTNGTVINNEINYMRLAEDKLQNMEKIADLTDKCTKRLSNLAKVLEEVRKNKTMAYNPISSSDSTPELEQKSDEKSSDKLCLTSDLDAQNPDGILKENVAEPAVEFIPLLKDIPKPDLTNLSLETSINPTPDEKLYIKSPPSSNSMYVNLKSKKPPPAMTRINLKHGTGVTPHELSTVVEVDSPMSLKIKSQSLRTDIAEEVTLYPHTKINDKNLSRPDSSYTKRPDSHDENVEFEAINSISRSFDNSKLQMMDMKRFNDIMLKPFISLQEYAKQCNIGIDEGSNNDDILRENLRNDELSSLPSDSSLPDIIGELLKRNIISEPFKFDSGSNNNSTALSSESTLSILALSNAYRNKLLSDTRFKQRQNAETSESISISSNPDLENAFQKLGMGWASSTLKKTKERLALTSSSSTSSSSMPRFKVKSFNQQLPNISMESTSSQIILKKKGKDKVSIDNDNLKNAVQQTSLTNSMTVKEFLTNELAKKITFTNKSHSNGAEVEYISLYETKMPEEMKYDKSDQDHSNLSTNCTSTRPRTSTPVQIFRSTKYHSSSSSNASNGLFSNADDISSVKVTSNSIRDHSMSDKEDLTIPNYSLQVRKTLSSDSKSD